MDFIASSLVQRAVTEDKMNRHVSVVAILNIAWGMLGLFGAIVVGFIFSIPMLIFNAGGRGHYNIPPEGEAGIAAATLFGFFLTAFIMAVCIPGIAGGIGLLSRRNWARILVLVVSFFNLMAFPLGTALGIYGIWALWDKSCLQGAATLASAT